MPGKTCSGVRSFGGVHRRAAIAVGASLVLITINLRLALGSVSPVLDDIRDTLGLSSSTAGLLTTAPVLCFGLAAPLAPRLARRFGQEALLLFALVGVIVGLLLRVSLESVVLLFGGTLLLGVTIAVANVLMPSVIKRRFERPGLMMGLFTMSLSVSAALGAAFTVPLEEALGGWRPALAFWAVPAVLAAVLWAPEVRRSGRGPSAGSGRRGAAVARPDGVARHRRVRAAVAAVLLAAELDAGHPARRRAVVAPRPARGCRCRCCAASCRRSCCRRSPSACATSGCSPSS